MLSFKVTKAPQGFPFPNAITKMWSVLYFEPQGDKATRVRGVSLGFGDDEESTKMRQFFNRGNAITLEHLQKRFAPKTDAKQDKLIAEVTAWPQIRRTAISIETTGDFIKAP